MADFGTYNEAEARAVAKREDKTWINAHVCRATSGGKIAVRVQRPMSAASPDNGGWVEITSDSGV